MKIYSLFKTKDPENDTLFCGTYPSKPNKGVAPGIQGEAGRRNMVPFSLSSLHKLPIYGLITNEEAVEHHFSVYLFKKMKFDLSPSY